MRIGLAQLNSRGDKSRNMALAEVQIRKLADEGAGLVMLPEHTDFIGPDHEKRGQAESIDNSSWLEAIGTLASSLQLYIHIGSFLERDEDKIYNTAVVIDSSGEIVATYRKIHLFDVEIPGGRTYLESEIISPGNKTTLFTIGDFIFGMATCYDLRFPELFRSLMHQGANVLLLPAAFTRETGEEHWELLLRARAVENQCWVAAVGQWGTAPPNHDSYGNSMVINPWGKVITRASDGISIVCAEIELQTVQSIRTTFPANDHVRRDLF